MIFRRVASRVAPAVVGGTRSGGVAELVFICVSPLPDRTPKPSVSAIYPVGPRGLDVTGLRCFSQGNAWRNVLVSVYVSDQGTITSHGPVTFFETPPSFTSSSLATNIQESKLALAVPRDSLLWLEATYGTAGFDMQYTLQEATGFIPDSSVFTSWRLLSGTLVRGSSPHNGRGTTLTVNGVVNCMNSGSHGLGVYITGAEQPPIVGVGPADGVFAAWARSSSSTTVTFDCIPWISHAPGLATLGSSLNTQTLSLVGDGAWHLLRFVTPAAALQTVQFSYIFAGYQVATSVPVDFSDITMGVVEVDIAQAPITVVVEA